MESFIKRVLEITMPNSAKKQAKIIGWKNVFLCFFFQRILRINSHAPWPVHWSSRVICPRNIKRKAYRPFPGYMPGQYIQAINGIEIGSGVRMGPGVKLISANHDLYDYSLHCDSPPIIIGDNCWLGAGAIILPGVKLGDHVVIAAGAVVNKSFEENDIVVAGVPAKVVKKIYAYNKRKNIDNVS